MGALFGGIKILSKSLGHGYSNVKEKTERNFPPEAGNSKGTFFLHGRKSPNLQPEISSNFFLMGSSFLKNCFLGRTITSYGQESTTSKEKKNTKHEFPERVKKPVFLKKTLKPTPLSFLGQRNPYAQKK